MDQRTRTTLPLVVLTCADRCPGLSTKTGVVSCSAMTRSGIDQVRAAIQSRLATAAPADLVVATAVRCRQSLASAGEALRVGQALVDNQAGEELVARQLRDALDALGEVVGAVYTEDLLDRIFSRFCIGK